VDGGEENLNGKHSLQNKFAYRIGSRGYVCR
jgi:hypothetical protein